MGNSIEEFRTNALIYLFKKTKLYNILYTRQ
ncbi:hypothetical protein BH23BAC1_BH23BAC1_15520 [soil metagenome]